jgi:hypothetical protein
MSTPALGWNDEQQANVVKVTENWIVAVTPMIYNDRIILATHAGWKWGYTAGFCYDKGPAAILAASLWNPETERYPLGYKKIACDSRPGEPPRP